MAYGGWTGKTLRVDLSTGKISVEDTIANYKDWMGGTGVGYKVLWDEVPAKTPAYAPENKIIVGVGPLTGTGAPCGGRTSVTTIWPSTYPVELAATGHMGGHFGAEMKFAGWDNIIIEGKSSKPVWLRIEDDKVSLEDADQLWGNGIYRATQQICELMGPDAQVAAIGQAGENLLRLSTLINGFSHSAGGVGGVFGSKNLKAIGVRGTGAVKLAADPQTWKEYVRYALTLVGANNQHVVPSTPQPWAEYYNSGSRWTARKGLYWGAANPPVETGECPPDDLNKIGYRTDKAVYDFGAIAERFHVRQSGCHSCPVRCHVAMDVPSVQDKYGLPRYATNTCVGWSGPRGFVRNFPDDMVKTEATIVGKHMADDYGVWCSYGLLQRTFAYAYDHGILKAKLPEAEYKSVPWAKYDSGDPEFLIDIYRRIAFKQGVLGKVLGEGPARIAEQMGFPEEYYADHKVGYWKMGHPYHHGPESEGQAGVLYNLMYNRDCQMHSHTNFTKSGLPIQVQKTLAAKVFGSPDAVDAAGNYTPINEYKVKFAIWSIMRKELHDSLTLCNWMFPWIASPLKERNYEGDTGLEAKFYSLVTGDEKSEAELDNIGLRFFTLQRALTIRDWGTKEMRKQHDTVPDWAFDDPPDQQPFTKGSFKMDRNDIEQGKDMFYDQLKWNRENGAPTRAAYQELGMDDVADVLDKDDLLG